MQIIPPEDPRSPIQQSAPIAMRQSARILAPMSVVLAHLQQDDCPVQIMWHVVDTTRVSESTWIWQFVLSRSLWWSWDCEREVMSDAPRVAWQSMPERDPWVQVAFDLRAVENIDACCEVALQLTANSARSVSRWAMAHTQAVARQFVHHTLRQLQQWVECGEVATVQGQAHGARSSWDAWRQKSSGEARHGSASRGVDP